MTLLGLFGAQQSFGAHIVIRCRNLGLYEGESFQFARIFAPLWGKTNWKIFQEDGSVSETYPKISGSFSWIFLILSESPPRTPIASTQKLWQNTSYLQLSGLNNWFYVFTTLFAQHLNICSPKLVEWLRLLPPPGDASGNSLMMAVWFWTFCWNCKPVDNSRWPWKDKFGMVSEICNRQKNT